MPLIELARYFLILGSTGFGGPVALAGRMQTDLVDQKKVFTADEYGQGLALAKLSPGPLAAQLAMYLGWLRGGIGGATVAGVALILPSFVMVVALAWLYLEHGQIAGLQRALSGVGAAVIALVAMGAYKLVRKTTSGDAFFWLLVGVLFFVTVLTGAENVILVLLCGVVALVRRWIKNRPGTSLVVAAPAIFWTGLRNENNPQSLWEMGVFFAKAGSFVFGSGLAIVPFLQPGVVTQNQWLTQQQFVDAVAVAMVTPGPILIMVAFIGFLVAGISGALVCTIATFLPCYLIVLVFAPVFKRIMKNIYVKEVAAGITAAACGAIAGSAVLLGRQTLVSPVHVAVCATTLVCLIWFKKIPEPVLLLVAGGVGFFI